MCVWRLLGKKIVNFQRPFFAWRALSHVVVCSSLLLYETVVAWFMKCWKWLLNNYLSFLRCFLASKKNIFRSARIWKWVNFPKQFVCNFCTIAVTFDCIQSMAPFLLIVNTEHGKKKSRSCSKHLIHQLCLTFFVCHLHTCRFGKSSFLHVFILFPKRTVILFLFLYRGWQKPSPSKSKKKKGAKFMRDLIRAKS